MADSRHGRMLPLGIGRMVPLLIAQFAMAIPANNCEVLMVLLSPYVM
jgi:hypothetical protein